MFSLRKTTTYALTSLAHMAERRGRLVSAREIAEGHGLPLSLLMKILKVLHQKGILISSRGAKGGYQIGTDLQSLSLFDLTNLLQSGLLEAPEDLFRTRRRWSWLGADSRTPSPLLALQYKLVDYLDQVKVSDLVQPGKRIDVPFERVGIHRKLPTALGGPTINEETVATL